MSALFYVVKEMWASITEDYLFTLAILTWVFVVAILRRSVPDATWDAPILLIGLLALLLFSVASAYRMSSVSTKHKKPTNNESAGNYRSARR
jgi:ABC-type polysaccharide/polyol phosphate export permease